MNGSISSGIRAFSVVTAVVFLAFALIGCGGDSNPGGDKSSRDSRLVNSAGQAWILDVGIEIPGASKTGFIFKANGDLETITNATGT